MALQIGIVGLPNVGKSTLFNALTGSRGAEAANYPFCTIEPNVGVVEVPDDRLKKLTEMVKPEKVIPAAVEFVDIAGLVKGASKGEGLGNKFLGAIREVDAICHVVRAFDDGNIIHVDGSVDAKRDRETIETELILADLDAIEKRYDKAVSAAKSGDKDKAKERDLLKKIQEGLSAGNLAISVELDKDEKLLMKMIPLLTYKPIIYAMNVAETELKSFDAAAAKQRMNLHPGEQVIAISAKVEEDLQDLTGEERAEFLKDLGITSSGLDQLIRAAYDALGYITFFTAGPKEVRAWNVTKGSTAPNAAGVIHTDFERGFIRAETIAYQDFVNHGGETGAKEAGKMRQEGKEYIVKDGDIFHFRFNV